VTVEKTLVTRNEVREMGLQYSNTHFIRFERAGLLTPIKVSGCPSSRVYYRVEQVLSLIRTTPRMRS
jgi:hypothetical protein